MALCKHYEVCPCAQSSSPVSIRKETTPRSTPGGETETNMQRAVQDVMSCYAELMSTASDNCNKAR